ncbi:S41 family peptidase [Pseudoalteromonas luteoviolacea]|uniref:Tail specific protease domain-containing protein n=1 Tax=Pseudoalteromonas luteoviolacea H33 TaxID=1365251 RepID=A0A167DY90_9GAMM|nr:S41 family peptidase [Pseudoalteromonas luteoviolacea]KZN49747.1 hypothetical protein N476_18315 [Pseudoalteromonas luteoviolacea H33]KZN77771.1 hypothetical protein N477_00770 [Pseudoalteromonas luteoviolacea H33-S]
MHLFTVCILLLSFFNIGSTIAASTKTTTLSMSNDAHKIDASLEFSHDSIAYYKLRNQAKSLTRDGNFKEALPLLLKLAEQYQNDGEIWYLLGIAQRQFQDFRAAIHSFKQALALGVRVHGIKGNSSNPNDLMVTIARLYAQLDEEAETKYWLTKALNHRWDDKPKLAGTSLFTKGADQHFTQFHQKSWYQDLVGVARSFKNPVEGWRYDLAYLVAEINRLHANPFHSVTEIEFNAKVEAIYSEIPRLTDSQIVFEFMRLLAMVNNGHNFFVPAWGKKGNFTQLPMQFYQFRDGLYIVAANDEYQQYIGHKVIKFNGLDTVDVLKMTDAVNAKDNTMQRLWQGPYYLSLLPVLEGLGVFNEHDPLTLTLLSSKGVIIDIKPQSQKMNFNGFPKLPKLGKKQLTPLYLQNVTTAYFDKEFLKQQSLYVQFNQVQNTQGESLKDFNKRLQQRLLNKEVKHFILDLRHNSGGNGSLLAPMIKTAVLFEALNPDGKFFIIAGRNTYSAGHDLLVRLLEVTDPIIVGEPSGTRPNTIGEAGWFTLPYSGQKGIISSQFHQKSSAEDHRIWIAPDMPIALDADDYFNGNDIALDAVFKYISHQANR